MKRGLVKCTSKDVIKLLALQLDTAITFQQVRKLVMLQTHDEFTGMFEGDNLQPLYNPEAADNDKDKEEEDDDIKKAEEHWKRGEEEYLATALKGNVGVGCEGEAGKGKSKGYGECWNCGQQGRPPGNVKSRAVCTAGCHREQCWRLHSRGEGKSNGKVRGEEH